MWLNMKEIFAEAVCWNFLTILNLMEIFMFYQLKFEENFLFTLFFVLFDDFKLYNL